MEDFFIWLKWSLPDYLYIDVGSVIFFLCCFYWLWVIRLQHNNQKKLRAILDKLPTSNFKAERGVVHQVNKLLKGTQHGKQEKGTKAVIKN